MIRPGRATIRTRAPSGARYGSGVAEDCVFCSMVAGDIPVDTVYSDDAVIAFADINPQAPTHVLVVPRAHVRDLVELAADADLSAQVLAGIRATVTALGVGPFRTVFNTGAEVGQSVFHVHAHVLAGRPFGWPPG
jgi:histidine triad (HIT) family protein